MALQDLLDVSSSHKKVGLSEERVMAIVPVARDYVSFWREYPDLFVDFLTSNFSGYQLSLKVKSKKRPEKDKTIYVDSTHKNRITELTNEGKRY